MRATTALFIAAATLAVAGPAAAHGPTNIAFDPSYAPPSVWEVEQAIDGAAAEFAVPAELLHAMAWVESRYEHVPFRVSADGRAGNKVTVEQRRTGRTGACAVEGLFTSGVATGCKSAAEGKGSHDFCSRF